MTTLLALLISLTGGCPRDSVLDEYHPPQYGRAVHLVEYLKRQQPGMLGWEAEKARIPDADSVLAYVAPSGLTMTDVNDSSTRGYTRAALRTALRQHSSHAFTTFAHLGFMYGQRPSLTYRSLPNGGVVVCVDEWYRLAFVNEHQQLYLRQLDYVMNETE